MADGERKIVSADEVPPEVRQQLEIVSADEVPAEVRAQLESAPAPSAPVDPEAHRQMYGDLERGEVTQGRGLNAPGLPITSAGGAFGRGLLNAASLGLADEAAGAGADRTQFRDLSFDDAIRNQTPLRTASRGLGAPLASDQGGNAPAAMQADWRQLEAADAARHGTARMAGQLVGGTPAAVASSAIPGGLAAQGAALGGANAFGNSEHSLADSPAALALDTGIGAAAGAGTGYAVGKAAPVAARGIGDVYEWLGQKFGGAAGALERGANSEAVGATGAYGGDARKLMRDFGPNAVNDLGGNIRAQGIGDTSGALGGVLPHGWETYARNAEKQLAEIGPQIEAASDAATKAGVVVNPSGIVDDLIDQATKIESLPQIPALQKQSDELLQTAVALDKRGTMSFADAVQFRRKLDDLAWEAAAAKQSEAAKSARELASKMRETIAESLKNADPELAAQLSDLNQRYATAARVSKLANTRIAKEAGLQIGGLTGKLAGMAGFMHGLSRGDLSGAASEAALGYAADKAVKELGHAGASRVLAGGANTMGALGRSASAIGQGLQSLAPKVATPAGSLAAEATAPALSSSFAPQLTHAAQSVAATVNKPNEREIAYEAVRQQTDPDYRRQLRERAKQGDRR